jgi:tetratricopeptide (TPR) repeat protein
MIRTLYVSLVLALSAIVAAQSGESAKANELFQAGKFAEAKAIYAKLATPSEKSPSVWMRLAFCMLQTDDLKGAISAYETAIANGANEGHARYNIACAHARSGDKAKALEEIEKSAGLGFARAHMLKADEDFASIREEARFKALMDKLAHPTKGMKGADAMDLWIGEWDVTANGQFAGSNSITRVLDGYAIEEKWSSARGGKGQSLFTFDPANGTWRQLWVDDRGWTIEKIGKPIENGILFEGWSINADGSKQRAKTTLTKNPDGTVRQVIEFEDKDGKWSVVFDGHYVRRKK